MKKVNQLKSEYHIGLYVRVSTEEQAENPEGSNPINLCHLQYNGPGYFEAFEGC